MTDDEEPMHPELAWALETIDDRVVVQGRASRAAIVSMSFLVFSLILAVQPHTWVVIALFAVCIVGWLLTWPWPFLRDRWHASLAEQREEAYAAREEDEQA